MRSSPVPVQRAGPPDGRAVEAPGKPRLGGAYRPPRAGPTRGTRGARLAPHWGILLLAGVVVVAAAGGASAASAPAVAASAILTYSFTGTANGTLNATPFSNEAMTLSVTGNTSKVVSGSSGHYELDYAVHSATFSISGVGSGTLNHTGSVDDNQQVFQGGVGLYDNGAGWLVLVDDALIGGSALASYALNTSFGPTTPQASNPSLGDFVNVPTSAGKLTITGESHVTFQAAAPSGATSTSASLYLLVGGLVCVAAVACVGVYLAVRRHRAKPPQPPVQGEGRPAAQNPP